MKLVHELSGVIMPTTQSSEAFQVIQDYHQLELSHLLKEILQEQQISIPELYKRLQGQDYYLSLESLYRYFSSSSKSNRFPPEDFILAFAESLHLNEIHAQLLHQFWRHYKLLKRCHCDR